MRKIFTRTLRSFTMMFFPSSVTMATLFNSRFDWCCYLLSLYIVGVSEFWTPSPWQRVCSIFNVSIIVMSLTCDTWVASQKSSIGSGLLNTEILVQSICDLISRIWHTEPVEGSCQCQIFLLKCINSPLQIIWSQIVVLIGHSFLHCQQKCYRWLCKSGLSHQLCLCF